MVSSLGRVKTAHRGIISYGHRTADGYRVSRVAGRTAYVHRLVAHAFLGAPPTEHHCDVHHIDGNRCNNVVRNLEYTTRRQNILYSWQRPNRRGSAVAMPIPVLGRRVGGNVWQRLSSMSEAERQTGILNASIVRCCYGRYKHAQGWEFQLAERDIPETLLGERWTTALHPDSGESLYGWEVSSFGRMRSPRGRTTWGSASQSGYYSVGVSSRGSVKRFLVHRVVARSFLSQGPPPSPWVINHKDGKPSNNHVGNLEFSTHSHNHKHSYRTNCRRRSNVEAVSKPVWGRMLGADQWQWYPSGTEASRSLGIQQGAVSGCCRGRQRQTSGYEFHFAAPAVPELLEGEEWRTLAAAF